MKPTKEQRSAILAGIKEYELEEVKATGAAPLTPFQRLALLNYICDRLEGIQ